MKAIRLILILSACAFLAAGAHAQSSVGQEAFATYTKEHAYYVTDLPKEKLDDQRTAIGRVDEKEESAENWGIEPKERAFQYFRIGTSDQMLVVKSLELLRREFHSEK